MNKENDLNELIGRDLAGVYFVRDYVQLYFDGPTLTLITDPTVCADEQTLRFPANGSRELMCQLIGLEITGLSLDEDDRLQITFGSHNFIEVSLRQEDRIAEGADAISYFDLKNGDHYQWWL